MNILKRMVLPIAGVAAMLAVLPAFAQTNPVAEFYAARPFV